MKALRWIGLALSALLMLISAGAALIASSTQKDATAALHGALALYNERKQVSAAQDKLGTTDFRDALDRANDANDAGSQVGAVTRKIVALLDDTRSTAADISVATSSGAATVGFTKRLTSLASGLLQAISGYQQKATSYSNESNKALRKILVALKATNRSFP